MNEPSIAAAEARAAAARQRLSETLAALKHRLLPGTLARNVAHGLAEKGQEAAKAGVEAAKARPALAVGAAALAALLFARKPLTRVMTGNDDASETDADTTRSGEPNPRKADR